MQLIGAAVALVLTALLAFGGAVLLNRQRASLDTAQVGKLRRKRFAQYDEARRDYQKLRKKIETGNTVLIDIIHDLGDDFVGRDSARQQITFDEAFEAVAAIRQANARAKILVVLHTLGGYARPAHMIAMALKHHIAKSKGYRNLKKDPRVVAYIPYIAMSGGTMIALAADKVVMDDTASIGPIDTIYGGFSAEAYEALLEQKGVEATQDVLVMLAHEAKKYDRYAVRVARTIINDAHKDKARPEHHLADHLSSGRMSHSEAITAREAEDLGMNVSRKLPEAVAGLVDARIRMINTRIEFETRRQAGEEGSERPSDKAEHTIEQEIRQSLRGSVRI